MLKRILGATLLFMSIVLFFATIPKVGLEVPNFLSRLFMGMIGFYYLVRK